MVNQCDDAKVKMDGQVAESLNIANGMNATELCNSRAEYHQPQIVRVSREVQRGL